MNTTVLISLGFRKRSGKDEIADYFVSSHGFKKLGWADLLKAGVNTWHGWNERHAFGDLKEVVDPYWGYSPREAYQKIGTDLMRWRWRESFWVDCAMLQVKAWLSQGHSVVIPDSRFPNEAEAVLNAGGHIWRVDRPCLPAPNLMPKGLLSRLQHKIRGQAYADKYDHPSETSLLGFAAWSDVIVNDGTIPDLRMRADAALKKVLDG